MSPRTPSRLFLVLPLLVPLLALVGACADDDVEPPKSCPPGRHPTVICVEISPTDGCAAFEGACVLPCSAEQAASKYCNHGRAGETCGLGDLQPVGVDAYCYMERDGIPTSTPSGNAPDAAVNDTPPVATCEDQVARPSEPHSCLANDWDKSCTSGCVTCTCEVGRWKCTSSGCSVDASAGN